MKLIRKLIHRLSPHYVVIGPRTQEVIGCCTGSKGKAEVLSQEFGASFKRVKRNSCPICRQLKEM